MDYLTWVQNTSTISTVQERINSDCAHIVKAYFGQADEYAVEKYLKSYTEKFKYLESLLLHRRNIAPEDIESQMGNAQFIKDYRCKHAEVEKIMLSEVSREFRHALTYLPCVQLHAVRQFVSKQV